jgi:hypothetical protein
MAEKTQDPEEQRLKQNVESVILRFQANFLDGIKLNRLYTLLYQNPGNYPVSLEIILGDSSIACLQLIQFAGVNVTPEFVNSARKILAHCQVIVQSDSTEKTVSTRNTLSYIPRSSSDSYFQKLFPFKKSKRIRPPVFAEYLLHLFLSKQDRDPFLGDMEQEFREIYQKFHARKANFWYYKQVLLSLWPLLCAARKNAMKIGLLGIVLEFIRQFVPWLMDLIHKLFS